MSKTLSYKGQLPPGEQDRIRLKTNNGKTGYKITKFQLMPEDPVDVTSTAVVKVFSIPQSGIPTNEMDFSDNTLLAAGFMENSNSANFFGGQTVIFDNTTFNQDIDLTSSVSAGSVNYYIEIEQVRLSLNENTVATSKDIRNIEASQL